MRFAELGAVTVDGFGTLVQLVDPAPPLREALAAHGVARSPDEVRSAFATEGRHYRARTRRRHALRAGSARDRVRAMDLTGRLTAWLFLVGALAALQYGTRLSGGKPPKNSVYHWNLAIGGTVQFALILIVAVAIAWGGG